MYTKYGMEREKRTETFWWISSTSTSLSLYNVRWSLFLAYPFRYYTFYCCANEIWHIFTDCHHRTPNDPALQPLPWTLRRRKYGWRLEERCYTNARAHIRLWAHRPLFPRCSVATRWDAWLFGCMVIYGLLIGITFVNRANLNLILCTFVNRCAINDISSIFTQNCEYWSWVGTYIVLGRASVCRVCDIKRYVGVCILPFRFTSNL